uniref:NADH-ubiquinone oxidoreductase chain 6 n=1 Tax=Apteropeda orbiculata TaxID=467478 RepID=A0A3G1GT21_9CUCU|nr:NADH dehydrogenase subunit 6 [Apteropeda orbiculata]
MLMLLPLLIINSFMLIIMKHPLSCGLILLTQTILTAIMSGLMNYNFWYSYILFLIMIGGMLILFIYMTSIASNEKFKFNMKMMLFLIMAAFIMSMVFMFIDSFYLNMINQLMEMKMSWSLNNNISLMKYFNYPNYFIMIMLISYLFITLIAIIKITMFSYGSLRQKL